MNKLIGELEKLIFEENIKFQKHHIESLKQKIVEIEQQANFYDDDISENDYKEVFNHALYKTLQIVKKGGLLNSEKKKVKDVESITRPYTKRSG